MNRKEYMKPVMQVSRIATGSMICTSPASVKNVSGNGSFIFSGAGTVNARANERSAEEEMDALSDESLW